MWQNNLRFHQMINEKILRRFKYFLFLVLINNLNDLFNVFINYNIIIIYYYLIKLILEKTYCFLREL